MKKDSKHRNAPHGFDPKTVDEILGTGGGLLGELGGLNQPPAPHDACQWLGVELGPFVIDEFLARGGMSLVFSGRRQGSFEQRVAIKLLRTPDSGDLEQRFQRERQLLADLEHPGIARIIDGGVTDGQPWIAMELVEGLPIDEYCDRHQLNLERRLHLFAQVGMALQFAHGRMVVHRDIKPGNILVTDDGQPRLLDFGIAKVLDPGAEVDLTGSGLLLTPLYASPEQVMGDPVALASDVYQMGLLLYRLLTGAHAQSMENASIAEIKSIVVEREPPSPSSHVETTRRNDAASAEEIALARSTSVSTLNRRLRGDLDTIVLHALAKNPEDRYPSVERLVADIESYRQKRPISARPATPWYRVSRFAQRHRGGVLTGALTMLLLVAAVIATGLSWRTTIQAQREALDEADGARQVGEFLAAMLEQADPSASGGEEFSVRELLDQSAGRLGELADRPRIYARLSEVMASAYKVLAQYDQADALATQALTVRERLGDPLGLVEPLRHLAVIKMGQGQLDESLVLGWRAVAAAVEGGADPLVLASVRDALAVVLFQKGLYAEEREQLLAALELLENEDGDRARILRADSTYSLGKNSVQLGHYEAARREFESVLDLLGDAPNQRVTRMWALRDLGNLLGELGEQEESVRNLGLSLDQARTIYGDDSAMILGNLVLLGRAYSRVDEYDRAEPLFLEALAVAEKTIGTDHGNHARILHDYAAVLRARGQFRQLRDVRGEAVKVAEAFFGSSHSTTVNLRAHEAVIELDEGFYPEAVQAIDRVLPEVIETFGERHFISFQVALAQARALVGAGDLDRAHRTSMQLVNTGRQVVGGRFRLYRDNLVLLAQLHYLEGNAAAALETAERAMELHRSLTAKEDLRMLPLLLAHFRVSKGDAEIRKGLSLLPAIQDPITVQTWLLTTDFARAAARAERHVVARRLCRDALAALESALAAESPLLAYARVHCAEVDVLVGDRGHALLLIEAGLPVIISTLGRDNWQTQWALALRAIASNRPQGRLEAISRLSELLGPNSLLIIDLSDAQ